MSLGVGEQRFLLRAALELPVGQDQGILDWRAVAGRARDLGIAGLAWHAVIRSGLELGREDAAMLRRFAVHDAAQTALTVDAFVRATKALRAAGLDCMALKGVAITAMDPTYVALRHVSDLDLLVPSTSVEEAATALVQDGARPVPRRPTMSGDAGLAAAAVPARSVGIGVFIDATGVPIDLHVRPPAEVEGGVEGLWGRSVLVKVRGTEVRVPCASDLLRIACDHVLQHHLGEPKMLPRHVADVGRLVRLHEPAAAPERSRAMVATFRMFEEAHRVASSGRDQFLWASRVGRSISPAWCSVEGAARALAFNVRDRASVLATYGWAAIFPSRAYLAASYGVPADTWWLPALHVRRLLVDQPLAVLGRRRRPSGDPPPR